MVIPFAVSVLTFRLYALQAPGSQRKSNLPNSSRGADEILPDGGLEAKLKLGRPSEY